MIFKAGMEPKISEENHIFYLGIYNKYWLDRDNKIKNPLFDRPFSDNIINIKNNEPSRIPTQNRAIDYFFNLANPILGNGFPIIVVPSHDPTGTINSGIYKLANRLSNVNGRINATLCLERKSPVPSAHNGGDRSEALHLLTITSNNAELLVGKDVLLMDDVTTKGGSMNACRKILLHAGAKSVTCFALGKTQYI